MTQPKNFEIRSQEFGDVTCLYLKGYLDAHTAPDLETAIDNNFKSGRKKLVVVFRDLDYISSAGLGVFMAFIEEIRYAGGDIKLADMKTNVYSVFDLLGFPLLFDIDKTEQLSIDKFNISNLHSEKPDEDL